MAPETMLPPLPGVTVIVSLRYHGTAPGDGDALGLILDDGLSDEDRLGESDSDADGDSDEDRDGLRDWLSEGLRDWLSDGLRDGEIDDETD